MSIIQELQWRGLFADCSDPQGIDRLTNNDSFYCGFDPTASSLQIGNLVPMIAMAHLARSGIKPLALFGGATGSIGDPSGKASERQLKTLDEIKSNVAKQQIQFKNIFANLDLKVDFVNNHDWTAGMDVLSFLRDVGKYFTVNYMLAKDSVKSRLDGEGISFTEFSYMLLQAYDFLHLYQTQNCKLQIGGSDQWGNITAGLELIRKKIGGEAFALTFPLITSADGQKLGKSVAGTLWLDPQQTSPFRFHQYWLNIDDRDVIKLLKIMTFKSKEEIAELETSLKSKPEARQAQHALADSLCTLIHGTSATEQARKSAEVLFGGSMQGLDSNQLSDIFSEVPSTQITLETLTSSSIIDLLVNSKLSNSKGDARRLLQNGGVYLNNERVSDPNLKLAQSNMIDGKILVLRSGKKNYHLIKL